MFVLKVLIVEDDFIIADNLEEILTDAGYAVCGITGGVAQAIRLFEEHKPDLGIIDLRLARGEYGIAVASALRQRGAFGVLYASGNPDHPLLDNAQGEACIAKPYSGPSILAALRIVADMIAGRPAPESLPPGFRLLQGNGARHPTGETWHRHTGARAKHAGRTAAASRRSNTIHAP